MAAIKDLRFVVKALKTMSTRWEEIGMTADVIDLDQIKKEYRGTFFHKKFGPFKLISAMLLCQVFRRNVYSIHLCI